MANERLKNELDEALKNVHKTSMVELVDRFEGDLAESDLWALSTAVIKAMLEGASLGMAHAAAQFAENRGVSATLGDVSRFMQFTPPDLWQERHDEATSSA